MKLFFEDARANGFYQKDPDRRVAHRYLETVEKDHGRIETRCCWLVQGPEIEWLTQMDEWASLASIGAVEKEFRVSGGSGTGCRLRRATSSAACRGA